MLKVLSKPVDFEKFVKVIKKQLIKELWRKINYKNFYGNYVSHIRKIMRIIKLIKRIIVNYLLLCYYLCVIC